MKFQVLFVLLLLTCTCMTFAQGTYGDCCLGYVKRMRKDALKNIESYRMQETDGDCNLNAVVFVMKRREKQREKQRVCANPQDARVQKLVEALNARAANN